MIEYFIEEEICEGKLFKANKLLGIPESLICNYHKIQIYRKQKENKHLKRETKTHSATDLNTKTELSDNKEVRFFDLPSFGIQLAYSIYFLSGSYWKSSPAF